MGLLPLRVPNIHDQVVTEALRDIERTGRTVFTAKRDRQFATAAALAGAALVVSGGAIAVVWTSASLVTAMREPALWAALAVVVLTVIGLVVVLRRTRSRERLIITAAGFYTEVRRNGVRTRGISVPWGDVAEVWTRWFGALWPTSGTLLVCYALTLEAELRTRQHISPPREAMRRTDPVMGSEVHALPHYFGQCQMDVVEVMRQAHLTFGRHRVQTRSQAR